jgi:phenylacetic acid degradation operon negative regulatory protein
VVLSTLLGTDPPSLPPDRLRRAGELFGFRSGTVRTALSRAVASGEVVREPTGWYRLAGPLLERQRRQDEGRTGPRSPWSGAWRTAVVLGGPRPAEQRAELRRAMGSLRFGELRDGVWMRPDNLHVVRSSWAWGVVGPACTWAQSWPDHDADLPARLWDLSAWSTTAESLRRSLGPLLVALERSDPTALRPGFEVSAAVLRHLALDPLLPAELLPRRWPGRELRSAYERFDRAYRRLLRGYLVDGDPAGHPTAGATVST